MFCADLSTPHPSVNSSSLESPYSLLTCLRHTRQLYIVVFPDSVADVILGNIKDVRSLTIAPKVNVTTWAQSKRATTEVPAGPQEVLSKSLVDSSLIPEPVSVSTVTPLRFLR
ncbi:hypothetical protein PoB_006792300 [Plakobranchus ocellatus]|uniref:Uncharacterized protein n=1 Tax=Plakobranchus ocellatus TaxID=259542 RepID=A0AAV4DB31_9GAST|nr:hypothetical protein PoB_006792300 [Plakobranchus ocellatus]